jgi:hypothetical protein
MLSRVYLLFASLLADEFKTFKAGDADHVRRLTFDMRGAQKAQPFGHPLDGRVGRHLARAH